MGQSLNGTEPVTPVTPVTPGLHPWAAKRLVGRRGLRVALGVLWLVDAGLQAEPSKFATSYPLGSLAQSVMGAPGVVNHSIYAGIHPFVSAWPWWNLAGTLIQVLIGVGLITGRFTRQVLVLSFAWGAVIWWLGEGFGTLPSGFGLMAAGAPGAAVLYVFLGVLAWPRRDSPDVDRRIWRVVWTGLWVGAAVLQFPFIYPSGQVLRANLEEQALDSPRYLLDMSQWFSRITVGHGVLVSAVMALVEVVIGLAWLHGRTPGYWWLAVSIALSTFYWVVVQQLGGILTPDGTDPNIGPLMVLLALVAWPGRNVKAVDTVDTVGTVKPDHKRLEPLGEALLDGEPVSTNRR